MLPLVAVVRRSIWERTVEIWVVSDTMFKGANFERYQQSKLANVVPGLIPHHSLLKISVSGLGWTNSSPNNLPENSGLERQPLRNL